MPNFGEITVPDISSIAMTDFSHTEENYLKTIYHLAGNGGGSVSTNAIAQALSTQPPSVSDMLKRLAQKDAISYTPYRGAELTSKGKNIALWIIRKHRLWEVFLLEKLGFKWDEVHEVAEQLEHIKSKRMVEQLDRFLGYPKYDPHGDPIPDSEGNMPSEPQMVLAEAPHLQSLKVISVSDTGKSFLQYLDKVGIGIGSTITVLDKIDFDHSLEISLGKQDIKLISNQVAQNIWVEQCFSE